MIYADDFTPRPGLPNAEDLDRRSDEMAALVAKADAIAARSESDTPTDTRDG